jgi:lipoprotein-anchoring transpeptidase ErfK/SrfK
MRLRTKIVVGVALWLLGLINSSMAHAEVRVRINKASQTMTVWVNGAHYASYAVSTGRRGYGTPSGTYRAQRLAPRWYSSKYDNAPMHNAVFFHGGYAIHATSYVSTLGQPASHGCIRLHPSNAREFFSLVQSHGPRNTIIMIR